MMDNSENRDANLTIGLNISQSKQDLMIPHPWIFGSTLVILIVFGLLSNIVVMIGTKMAKLSGKPAYILIINQSIVDFLTALVCMPVPLAVMIAGPEPFIDTYFTCRLTSWLSLALYCQHTIVLFLILSDRFLAVFKPIFYREMILDRRTKRRCHAVLLAAWVTSFAATAVLWIPEIEVVLDEDRLFCLPAILTKGNGSARFTIPVVVCISTLLAVGYTIIIVRLKGPGRRTQNIRVTFHRCRNVIVPASESDQETDTCTSNMNVNNSASSIDASSRYSLNINKPNKKNSKSSMFRERVFTGASVNSNNQKKLHHLSVLFTVTTAYYIVVWVPALVVVDYSDKKEAIMALTWVLFTSTTVNPVLYGLRNSAIREGILKFFRPLLISCGGKPKTSLNSADVTV